MAAILVVEDEVDLCNLIRSKLEAEGHTIFQAFDGLTALTLVDEHRPQLVILDWMLPGMDGLAVCRQLRQIYLMPIIMLTARTEEIERIVTLDTIEIDLTPKEYELLLLLASHPGRAFSREFLLQHLWGYDYDGFDRTVDTHITRLRKKLGSLGEKIVTVWGVGYRFVT